MVITFMVDVSDLTFAAIYTCQWFGFGLFSDSQIQIASQLILIIKKKIRNRHKSSLRNNFGIHGQNYYIIGFYYKIFRRSNFGKNYSSLFFFKHY